MCVGLFISQNRIIIGFKSNTLTLSKPCENALWYFGCLHFQIICILGTFFIFYISIQTSFFVPFFMAPVCDLRSFLLLYSSDIFSCQLHLFLYEIAGIIHKNAFINARILFLSVLCGIF